MNAMRHGTLKHGSGMECSGRLRRLWKCKRVSERKVLGCKCKQSIEAYLGLVLLAEGAACVFVFQPHAQAAACAHCLVIAKANSHNLRKCCTLVRVSAA